MALAASPFVVNTSENGDDFYENGWTSSESSQPTILVTPATPIPTQNGGAATFQSILKKTMEQKIMPVAATAALHPLNNVTHFCFEKMSIAIIGGNTDNNKKKMEMKGNDDQHLFFVIEEDNDCDPDDTSNDLNAHFFDASYTEVMRIVSSLTEEYTKTVECPPGNVIGRSTRTKESGCFFTTLRVVTEDAVGTVLSVVTGPQWSWCTSSNTFKIFDKDGTTQEGDLSINDYTGSFPEEMDIKSKAMLLAALYVVKQCVSE